MSRRRWSGSSLSSNFSTLLVAGHLLSMGSTRLFGKLQAELHDLVADVKVPRLPLGRLLGEHHLDDVLAGRPVGLVPAMTASKRWMEEAVCSSRSCGVTDF
ncbi:MAG TPA: hypothetical protein EYO90_01155 [Candidatus Latescibacteria bacterium]|nr:hypothetical protein [Candidatus Latescibacterota bacterium]